ncbi:RagB/SusD family nutrient uptake outer membrane protein [Sinomicrobium pectinilyticum]|uniref:RagB/SusD family nutrient uptake outer membrane protein n=1 Tax=Sinomicrobium pectinilyticum TaxID=1084421 RepID=A0A3N0DYW7_SINP1|nr:RagB/SusD family nutrient uptake outer membrane protein [Sinomicrobium pectinilyticum]RNL80804.1 RagB/SusD family nutrient uptake outer membrane protein [Sinomicrobium pectinilyticum]
MKKYSIYIIMTALLFMSACDDRLDFDPKDDLTREQVYADRAGALGALTGIYSIGQIGNVFNGTLQLFGEWQSDNIQFVGSFPTFQEVSRYTTLADNTSISALWRDNWRAIGQANEVITFIPEMEDPDFTSDEREKAIAEAKFLRALLYFNMSNLFGHPFQVNGGNNLSIPLVTEPFDINDIKFPSRATLNDIHALIETDLTEAIPDLDNSDNARATKAAAQALLARLYLYREEFQKAAGMANEVINNSSFSLASDYNFYNTTANEFLFTLVNSETDSQTSNESFSGLTNPTPAGRGDAPFSQNLLDAYGEEEGDLRYSELIQIGADAAGNESVFTTKFPDAINNSGNAPVIRITEMYLTRAEANFRAGTSIGAAPLDDINMLRERADLGALASVDLDIILNERRKELAFEGHRRMDLLRNGMNLRREGMNNVAESALGANKTIFPIPVREVDINPSLEQNPGY